MASLQKKIATCIVLVTQYALAVLISSCSSGNTTSNASSVNSADTIKTVAAPTMQTLETGLPGGKLLDSVICKTDSKYSYALYLPSNYNLNQKFPCIYFFDAHARGSLPLKLYKELAEKYGFILIGSNNSKNNTPWQATNDLIDKLFSDTRNRINIDPKRIYTSGFSGGARVASAVGIINGGIAGIIACSAGFPEMNQPAKYKCDFFGIISSNDFNLVEMDKLDEMLAQQGFTYQILNTGNAHDWPSADDFNTAMLWMQANAIKEKVQTPNESIVKQLKTDLEKRIAAAKARKEWTDEYSLLLNSSKVLDGLSDISAYKTELSALGSTPDYTNAVSLKASLRQQEILKQQEFIRTFDKVDQAHRLQTVNELIHSGNAAKNILETQLYKRLLNFYGLVCYLSTNQVLHTNDLEKAAEYIAVFKKADPKNPDTEYLEAVYNMRKNNTGQTIAALKKAIAMGYNNLIEISTDPNFDSLHGNPDFQELVAEVTKKLR